MPFWPPHRFLPHGSRKCLSSDHISGKGPLVQDLEWREQDTCVQPAFARSAPGYLCVCMGRGGGFGPGATQGTSEPPPPSFQERFPGLPDCPE